MTGWAQRAVRQGAWAMVLLALFGFEWQGRLTRLEVELGQADAARRREIVRLLGGYRAERVRAALLRALADRDPGVRAEAANSVARVRLREATPVLLSWLDEPDADVRASAARALGRVGAEAATGPLVRALGDSNADVRRAAVFALGALRRPEGLVPLIGRLDDDVPAVRVEAAEALGRMGEPSAVVPLIGRARDDTPEVRVSVYGALGELRDDRATSALARGLRDDAEDARTAAIAALGRIGSPESVEALRSVLSQSDSREARAAVGALGSVATDEALSTLVDALARSETREMARETLLAVTSEASSRIPMERKRALTRRVLAAIDESQNHLHVTALSEVLFALSDARAADGAADVLLRAVRRGRGSTAVHMKALGATGSPEALVPLLEELRRPDPEAQAAALDALEIYFDRQAPDGRATDPLLHALGRVPSELRPRVVRLVGRLRAARAVPSLLVLLDHEDLELRLAAVRALGSIGDSRVASALLMRLDDDDAQMRFEAGRALGRTASTEAVVAVLSHLERRAPTDRHARLVALEGALAKIGTKLPPVLGHRIREVLRTLALSEDDGLAARAIDTMSSSSDTALVRELSALVADAAPARARHAAFVLSRFRSDASRTALRRALAADVDDTMRTAAVVGLGEISEPSDVPRIAELARGARWPVSSAAAFALARIARRGDRSALLAKTLCSLVRERHPYTRANAAAGLAYLKTARCEAMREAFTWLDPRHAAAVRSATVRWLAEATGPGRLPADELEAWLRRCIEADVSPEVVELCKRPTAKRTGESVDLYAYAGDGERLLVDRLVALRFGDGTTLVAITDANGHLEFDDVPAGRVILEDPAAVTLEP